MYMLLITQFELQRLWWFNYLDWILHIELVLTGLALPITVPSLLSCLGGLVGRAPVG